jgi:nucleotide-binding universal stress UspA family protein
MNENNSVHVLRAIQDFRSARQKAKLREIVARFTGASTELLSFDEVRHKLRAQIGSKKILKDIPIKAIIGSVNRYQDFSRDFLPRRNINEERWANIEAANQSLIGLPPIEAYQIDEAYFVSDGNHRVSVASQLGSTEIQAYVTEVHTRVPLTADVRPEDIILKSEYAEFVEHTNIDKLRPEADLSVTEPGQYEVIEEHIEVHRYFMGKDQQREIPYFDAVVDWYDNVYLPEVFIIREKGLLIDFPNRTETDLYLWIAEHRTALEDELDNQVAVARAAEELVDQFSHRIDRVISRIGSKIVKTFVPDDIETVTPLETTHQSNTSTHREDHLFCEILVPINGHQDGWCALDQAIAIAKREKGNIHGLYILKGEDKASDHTHEIQSEFDRKCIVADIQYDLILDTGEITGKICEYARHNDLVVLNLTYPPEATAFARLTSNIRYLIQSCPKPILFTPQVYKPLEHALLAYDGSQKAKEALYIAAYLVGQWNTSLHVISFGDESSIREIQADARSYLEDQQIHAEYLFVDGPKITEAIINLIAHLNIDLLLIGGYNRNPIVEVVQGSELDEILRLGNIPVLICR